MITVRILTMADQLARHHSSKKWLNESPSLATTNWSLFMAATHGDAGLKYDQAASFAEFGRSLSAAELSCYASHVSIIREFLEKSDDPYLIVFEDDLYVDANFNFQAAMKLMETASLDYLRFYARALTPAKILTYIARLQVLRFTWPPAGTQAYALSRRGAANFLQFVLRQPSILRPIDHDLDRYWETGNPIYAVYPWPVVELNAPTTIHTKEQVAARLRDDANTPSQSVWANFKKRIRAWRERFVRKYTERNLLATDQNSAISIARYLKKTGNVNLQ